MVRIYLAEIPEPEKAEESAGESGGRRARSQSAAARRLLMAALEKEYPELAGTFRVDKDERGKPFLRGHEEICISISHSGRLAACAVGKKPVGVDAEQRRSRPGRERIARRFHPEEFKRLESEPEEEKEKAFYDLWVRKESFLKAVGEGLRLRLDSFCTVEETDASGLGKTDSPGVKETDEPEASAGSRTVIRVSQNIRKEAYYIRQYELEGGQYSLAVCSEEADFAEHPEWLSAESSSK